MSELVLMTVHWKLVGGMEHCSFTSLCFFSVELARFGSTHLLSADKDWLISCGVGWTYRLPKLFQIVQEILDRLPLRQRQKETV